jgi:Protein of unknown function (DUF3551)
VRLCLLLLVAAIAGAMPSMARADQYRWCAVYSGGDHGGSLNCYFETVEQCRATVSGVGGICVPSPFDGNRAVAGANKTRRQSQSQGKKN